MGTVIYACNSRIWDIETEDWKLRVNLNYSGKFKAARLIQMTN